MSHAIAVLGSASDVGKSLVAAGLGRLYRDAGLDVAPYKAQNMANQAGVTADGLEMPRAQILQARACGLEPHVDMGPVLMKPVTATGAQIVLLGKAVGAMEASTSATPPASGTWPSGPWTGSRPGTGSSSWRGPAPPWN